MRAVHFGAGNIGRGFLGQLYFESGYQTTFIDVEPEMVRLLHERGAYPLRIVEEERVEEIAVQRVDAVLATEAAEAAEAVARADLGSTAVGVRALEHIAPVLARGIAQRVRLGGAQPLNLIVCENLLNAGPYLREKVRAHLPAECHAYLDTQVGFVEASIGRMVPVMTATQRAENPLLVCVEPYCELPVDAESFVGDIPPLKHLKALRNFGAYVERKLFVHNMSHAATAYLGYLRGHTHISEAIRDPAVRREVEGALEEACQGLARKHGLDLGELEAHAGDLVHRYHNRALGDQVARVARDPLRKLGPEDRLIGTARLCLEQEAPPVHVAFAAAAAFRYDPEEDPTACELQRLLREQGLASVLNTHCGAAPDSRLARLIIEADARHEAATP